MCSLCSYICLNLYIFKCVTMSLNGNVQHYMMKLLFGVSVWRSCRFNVLINRYIKELSWKRLPQDWRESFILYLTLMLCNFCLNSFLTSNQRLTRYRDPTFYLYKSFLIVFTACFKRTKYCIIGNYFDLLWIICTESHLKAREPKLQIFNHNNVYVFIFWMSFYLEIFSLFYKVLNLRVLRKVQLDLTGELPGFLQDTAHIRNDPSWRVNPVPDRLHCRHVDIGDLSPCNTQRLIMGLKSTAQGLQVVLGCTNMMVTYNKWKLQKYILFYSALNTKKDVLYTQFVCISDFSLFAFIIGLAPSNLWLYYCSVLL